MKLPNLKMPDWVRDLLPWFPKGETFGMVAEFEHPGALIKAARGVRDAGYKKFDVHSPFPIHGMDEAMGLGRSILPWVVMGGGMTGFVGGMALQIWTQAVDYPLVISGKPMLSIPAFIPVAFETTVLLSAFGAVFGMFALNLLPMLYHPLFNHKRFRRATSDGFFVSIMARDRQWDEKAARELLESLGGKHITVLEN